MIVAAYAAGEPIDQIATRFGVSPDEAEAVVARSPMPVSVQPDYPEPVPVGVAPQKTRRTWLWVAAALTAVIVVAGVSVGVYLATRPSPFETAQTACDPAKTGTNIADEGDTLLVDTIGKEDPTGVEITALACLVRELNVPSAVVAHMDSTRALDGRQEDTWPGFTASWSYHPDAGMDLIVRAV
jgi:hypothetical protein